MGLSGVNDPTCSSDHRPVVLLHGTLATAQGDFNVLAPALQATGRCVFTLDYGMGGTRSVRSSAKTVTAFIDQVLETTGALAGGQDAMLRHPLVDATHRDG